MVSKGRKYVLRLTAVGYFWLTYALVLNWALPVCAVDGNAKFRVDRDTRIKIEQARFQSKRHIPLIKKFHVEPMESMSAPWVDHCPTLSADILTRPAIGFVSHSVVVASPRAPPAC